jgi:nucleotide-binding universal stress UspA family protein
MNFKRILVAVDDTSIAAHAAEVGTGLAKLLGADLAFFHAIDTTTLGSAEGIPADELAKMAEREGRELLDAFRQRADTTPQALGFLEFGKPAKKILEGAKNWSADVIVIGSHGRGRVGSLLLGSVAEGVLRHAACPVLIVRARS